MFLEDGVDLLQLFCAERPIECAQAGIDFLWPAETDQPHADHGVGKHPAQRQMGNGLAMARCNQLQFFDHGQILREIFRGKEAQAKGASAAPPIIFGKDGFW